MKTTLMIDDTVFRRLKQEAARQGTTMSSLVEGALRRMFEAQAESERTEPCELPSFRSGGALVDVSDRNAIYEVMDREDHPA